MCRKLLQVEPKLGSGSTWYQLWYFRFQTKALTFVAMKKQVSLGHFLPVLGNKVIFSGSISKVPHLLPRTVNTGLILSSETLKLQGETL